MDNQKTLRIVDATSGDFLRDDFAANVGEVALDVDPSSGLHKIRWDFAEHRWYEGLTPEEIAALPTPEPVQTPEERIAELEAEVAQLTEILEAIT